MKDHNRFGMHLMDIVTTYLNSLVDEYIYMNLKGFKILDVCN